MLEYLFYELKNWHLKLLENGAFMKYLFISFFVLFSTISVAVTPIAKGDPSPGTGYFITPDEEKGFRKLNEENITLKDLSYHQDQKAQILEDRVKGYKDYVEDNKRMGGFEKGVYISIGVVGTVGLMFLATSVVKSSGK
jgi:hypothetical protein